MSDKKLLEDLRESLDEYKTLGVGSERWENWRARTSAALSDYNPNSAVTFNDGLDEGTPLSFTDSLRAIRDAIAALERRVGQQLADATPRALPPQPIDVEISSSQPDIEPQQKPVGEPSSTHRTTRQRLEENLVWVVGGAAITAFLLGWGFGREMYAERLEESAVRVRRLENQTETGDQRIRELEEQLAACMAR